MIGAISTSKYKFVTLNYLSIVSDLKEQSMRTEQQIEEENYIY